MDRTKGLKARIIKAQPIGLGKKIGRYTCKALKERDIITIKKFLNIKLKVGGRREIVVRSPQQFTDVVHMTSMIVGT
ncbi:hypothetical protein [Algoriphagus sp. 4150]|uniref:hypothetical protein n=1 Tax=Algoriphagus sp. 4150 TaxID=2817756 RepID=UPI00286C367B|nr:hypothetical protein [Algoriphagus sp. 4150]